MKTSTPIEDYLVGFEISMCKCTEDYLPKMSTAVITRHFRKGRHDGYELIQLLKSIERDLTL